MPEVQSEELTFISTYDLFPGSMIPFPIYLHVTGHYILFKPQGTIISEKDIKYMEENSIEAIFIMKSHEPRFTFYIDKNISKVILDPNINPRKKSYYLMRNADLVVKDIFEEPDHPQSLIKSQALVKNFVDFMKQGSLPADLISLSSHDYYTYTHSVGVMIHSLALASQLGITAKQTLNDIGLAGLFHDIGKTRISKDIISKPGPLTIEEWYIMKQHAFFSYEIAKDYNKLPEITLEAIKQHHENPKGTGYPEGIKGPDLYLVSKIISACDIFSAVTTDRSYSSKRSSFEALKLMKNLVRNGLVDKAIFENLVVSLKAL